MAVDEALSELARVIESGQPWPRPICPECQAGFIAFALPENDENHDSASARDHPAFEPEWVSGTFVIRGVCENPGCQLAVHGIGDFHVEYSQKTIREDETGPSYSDYFTVRQIHPPMSMMSIPRSAPEQVRAGVSRASRVLFADPGLAATALRGAVELFLTSEGIAATRDDGKFRSAHERIEEWRSANPDRPPVADLLFAVKWLGNAGTHEDSDLTAIEVLDGARVLDEAFHRLFTGPDIEARARSINSTRGQPRQR